MYPVFVMLDFYRLLLTTIIAGAIAGDTF